MSLKELGEGIILQALEDLFNETLREDCIAFFKGRGFLACAQMAGLDQADRTKLLGLVKDKLKDGTKQFTPKAFKTKYKRLGRKLDRPASISIA